MSFKQWGLWSEGVLHGIVELAEASFCESAANESAGVQI